MYALNLFSVWMLSPPNCNKNLNISLSRLKCGNSWSSKCGNREIKDCDAIRGMCILELKVLQIIHFNKLGIASKRSFFKSQLHFIDTEFSFPANSLNSFHVWCDTFTVFWFLHVYEISKLFQLSKDIIISAVASYKI